MKRTQEIELTNMCLVYNESSILVQEKVGTRHPGGLVFPGGHVEEGESLRDSIIREIKEETNLDVKIIDGFREVSDYCPFGNIKKRVVFFLAQAFTDDVVDQPEEIDSHIWVDIQQARKNCTYENDLRVIDKAELLINQSK